MSDAGPTNEPVALADWLERLEDILGLSGGLTEEEQAALLDIARIAAHTSVRASAPLTTFLAGVAYAELPSAERGPALRALAGRLEA